MKKYTLIILLLTMFSGNVFCQSNEKQITNAPHGYSFKIDETLWHNVTATNYVKEFIAQKNNKKSVVDYYFVQDTSFTVLPQIIIYSIATPENYFNVFKEKLATSVETYMAESKAQLKKKFAEIDFSKNSTIINDKDQIIIMFINIKTAGGTSISKIVVHYFTNSYALQFTLSETPDKFKETNVLFQKILDSIKLTQ